ncbi:unnamed protein product [Ascophyllum nodosum]
MRSARYYGLNADEDAAPDIPTKEMYVRSPPRLLRSAWWIAFLDLVHTVVAWGWVEGWKPQEFWENQVTKYRFDSAAIEVVLLAVVRLAVLAVVLGRSKACLVRVRGDGTIVPSAGAVVAMTLCAASACYCVFKIGFSLASDEGTLGGWAVAAVTAVAASLEVIALERLRRSVRSITARSFYEKLRAGQEDDLDGAELAEASDDDGGGPKALTVIQLAKVLKPYFWPKGDTPNAFMNRTRSSMTWVFVILSKFCSVTSPFFLSHATNALYDGRLEETMKFVGFYAVLAFMAKALKEAQSLVYLKVKQQAYIEIAEQSFAHLHTLSLQWHLKKKMGNVVRSMDRGTDAANNLITYLFLYLVPAIAECIATVIVFYVNFDDWRLATTAFVSLSLYGYVTVRVTLWRKKFRQATNKHDNDYHDKATDSIVNYETVKYFTNEGFEVARVKESVQEYQRFSVSTQASLSVLNVSQQVIMYSTLTLGLYFASQTVADGSSSVGEFVSVNTYMMNLFTPLYFLGTVYNIIIQAFVDIRNLSELLNESPDIVDAPGALDMDRPPKHVGMSVEFRDVWFWYPSQPSHRGLRGISFFVEPGTTTAVVGHTGAGKTTISRLLFRFYDPVKGMASEYHHQTIVQIKILLVRRIELAHDFSAQKKYRCRGRERRTQVLMNDQDIKTVTQQSVRRAIGVVPQDTVMFNDTILHNVRYGKMDATMQEVEEAAESAQIRRFIEQQPEGWNSKVGERGLKLSGGEKQRVAIARCLLKDPPIVLLDEATSALDSRTEKGVQEALNDLKTNRTTIVIAHRLSTIRNAEQIVVLHEGQIIERGNHDCLMELGGEYATMWKIQVQEREMMLSMEAERQARLEEAQALVETEDFANGSASSTVEATIGVRGAEERKESGGGGRLRAKS